MSLVTHILYIAKSVLLLYFTSQLASACLMFLIKCTVYICILTAFHLVTIETDKPQVRYLNKYVRDPLCAACAEGPNKWFELGLILMGEGSRNNLNVIKIDKANTYLRCDAMFGLWLQRVPDASWEQLINGLEEISMDDTVKDLNARLQGT